MTIAYDQGKGTYKNWLVTETDFASANLAKFETIFSLGNGYLGLRAATEEHYQGETRGLYLAGLFDEFPGEVTELPNLPDWLGVEISLAGEKFNLNRGQILSYERSLNLKDGQLVREIKWRSPQGRESSLIFKRFVSKDNLHLSGMKVRITPLNYSGKIKIKSGFNAQVTNSGTQHFKEGDQRVLAEGQIYITAQTQQSDIFLAMAADHNFFQNGQSFEAEQRTITNRRQLFEEFTFELEENKEFILEKLISIYSSRDREFLNLKDSDGIKEKVINQSIADLKVASQKGYDKLFQDHQQSWAELWQQMDITIKGADFDQLALRSAQFHLLQMTPAHDSRISVAAKGLSGEGYKGHVFWDTEIFILPFFIYTFPEVARKLLLYRYHTLTGARKKARENGYKGAMYAWESASTGEETTPKFGEVDVITGKPIRIWCGEIEQHITADIAYAIWHYYQATGDQDFIFKYGAEMILDTARFWASRLEYNQEKDQYEINDIIGPDEYSEHVDNNAYTNYMVQWHLKKAIEITNWLGEEQKNVWQDLKNKLDLKDEELEKWQKKAAKISIPLQEDNGLIPQFEGFMEKKEIDLSAFHGKVGAVVEAIGWEEVNNAQVLKQADVIILLYLLGDNFSQQIKKVNWHYYEPKTLHDSSLSPSVHTILAADMDELEKSYKYFNRSSRIDLGDKMDSSDQGLHSASLGGIWQAVVNGFAGLRIQDGKLRLKPSLPEKWDQLQFKLNWQGQKYLVKISEDNIRVENQDTTEIIKAKEELYL